MKSLSEELSAAIREFHHAEQEFDNAQKEFVDVGVWRLNTAIEKVNVLRRLTRESEVQG